MTGMRATQGVVCTTNDELVYKLYARARLSIIFSDSCVLVYRRRLHTFLSRRFSGFRSAIDNGERSTGQHGCVSRERSIQSLQKVCEHVVVIVGSRNGALCVITISDKRT